MEPFPLMNDNITREDINAVIAFLETMPRLTQSARVADDGNRFARQDIVGIAYRNIGQIAGLYFEQGQIHISGGRYAYGLPRYGPVVKGNIHI